MGGLMSLEHIKDHSFQVGRFDIGFPPGAAAAVKVVDDQIHILITVITARNYRGRPSGHTSYSNATNNRDSSRPPTVRSGNFILPRTLGSRFNSSGAIVADPTADLTIHERGALATIRHRIERLGPYQSLLLLAVPTSVVEPLKLIAVAIAGEGHWITGTIMIVAAYATSLLLLERLFLIVKPKLLTLNWFARLWTWLTSLRVVRWLKGAKSALGAGGAEPV
jgi:hypothetical protein